MNCARHRGGWAVEPAQKAVHNCNNDMCIKWGQFFCVEIDLRRGKQITCFGGTMSCILIRMLTSLLASYGGQKDAFGGRINLDVHTLSRGWLVSFMYSTFSYLITTSFIPICGWCIVNPHPMMSSDIHGPSAEPRRTRTMIFKCVEFLAQLKNIKPIILIIVYQNCTKLQNLFNL